MCHFLLILLLMISGTINSDATETDTTQMQTTNSDGSSLSSLSANSEGESASIDKWAKWNWMFGTGAVILTACALITAWVLLEKSSKLAKYQKEIIALKDRISQSDSKAKDQRISEANERAGNAFERGELAAKEAANANERAAALEAKAAILTRESESLRLESEKLHSENLALEETLSPRHFKDQSGAEKALVKFAGTKFAIICVADIECRRTGGQIAQALVDAKWEMIERKSVWDDFGFGDGVSVCGGSLGSFQLYKSGFTIDKMGEQRVLMDQSLVTRKISEQLVSELVRCGIASNTKAADLAYPEDVIVIKVGMKPNAYANRRLSEPNPEGQNIMVEGNRIYIPPPISK